MFSRRTPRLRIFIAAGIGIILSIILVGLCLFVLAQTLLAFRILQGSETIDNLVLFHNAVTQHSYSALRIGIFSSAAFGAAALITIITVVIKTAASLRKALPVSNTRPDR